MSNRQKGETRTHTSSLFCLQAMVHFDMWLITAHLSDLVIVLVFVQVFRILSSIWRTWANFILLVHFSQVLTGLKLSSFCALSSTDLCIQLSKWYLSIWQSYPKQDIKPRGFRSSGQSLESATPLFPRFSHLQSSPARLPSRTFSVVWVMCVCHKCLSFRSFSSFCTILIVFSRDGAEEQCNRATCRNG